MLDDYETAERPEDEVPPRPRPRSTASSSALAAAMIAVGEIIEPEKTTAETVQVAPQADDDDKDLDVGFGHLPPLD